MYKDKSQPFFSAAKTKMAELRDDATGKVAVPILLYFLGVPGILVLVLWALFFRGR